MLNAGQLGLGLSRPESSRPGSTRPGYLGLVLHSLLFSIKDASTILVGVCFIEKKVQQKFGEIMFGPIYIVGYITKQARLQNGSIRKMKYKENIVSRDAQLIFILKFFKKREKSAAPFILDFPKSVYFFPSVF